jgi:hypothetical protein
MTEPSSIMSATTIIRSSRIRQREDRRPDGARACRGANQEQPAAQGLLANWERMLNGPFRGITTDGARDPDLYAPRPEGAPTLAMIEASTRCWQRCRRSRSKSRAFRSAPIMAALAEHRALCEHYGLRLDEISEPLRDAVLAVLRASMSPHGYELSRDVMKLNRFLGDIVHGPR